MVAVFSTLAGLIYGAWTDGVGIAALLIYLIAFLCLLALTLVLVERRNRRPRYGDRRVRTT